MDFNSQIVLITGASSGIGKQLAIDFAKRGAVVIGCGRSIARLKDVLKQVRQTSPTSLMIGCDVSDPEQVHGMIEKSAHRLRRGRYLDQQRRHRHAQTIPPDRLDYY